MYRSFYQLAHQPFQITTDPEFLWLGESHKEALANLRYGLREGNGFVVLAGDVGTGKTTLVNALVSSLGDDVLVANITHPKLDSTEFLSMVVRMLDASAPTGSKADMLLFLDAFLRRIHAEDRRVLLVIDEAHRLSLDLLEEVRLWSNMEQNGRKLINVFFVGQSELKVLLSSSACVALRQRITLFHHLKPLSEAEVVRYVAHRLSVAGTERNIFSHDALRRIHKWSRGYPRRINIICDRAMLTGYVRALTVIEADVVVECAREIGVLEPKEMPAERIRRVCGDLGLKWRQAAVARRVAKVVSDTLQKGRRLFHRMIGASRLSLDRIGRAVIERCRCLSRIRREAVFMAALVAGCTVGLVFWFDTLPRQTDSTAFSTEAAILPGDVDEVEPFVPSPISQLNPINLPPDTPLALSGPWREVMEIEALRWSEGPAPLALASEALNRYDYQAVIAVIEADPTLTTGTDADASARHLYAAALVGRAGRIMTRSPSEAHRLISIAIENDPGRADAYVVRGKLYTLSKAYDSAIDAYRQAVALDPESTDALFNLGYIYASTGRPAEAEEMLRRVVALKPSYLDKALFNLAVVQQRQGRVDDSIQTLETALAADMENDKIRRFLIELKGRSR